MRTRQRSIRDSSLIYCSPTFKLLFDVHQCSPVFFLLNIVYFSVCLTSNKLYWIEDQLADVSTRFYTSASWTVGELTVIHLHYSVLASYHLPMSAQPLQNSLVPHHEIQWPTLEIHIWYTC